MKSSLLLESWWSNTSALTPSTSHSGPARRSLHDGGSEYGHQREYLYSWSVGCGEVACITLNGANRLGSNSLTECLVFGALSGRAGGQYALEQQPVSQNGVRSLADKEQKRIAKQFLEKEGGKERVSSLQEEMHLTMEKVAESTAPVRACRSPAPPWGKLRERFADVAIDDRGRIFNTDLRGALELEFMLEVAECITHSALAREESRGAQSRLDFPERSDEKFLHHQLAYALPKGLVSNSSP